MAEPAERDPEPREATGAAGAVARTAAWTLVTQLLGTPLAILLNAVMARYLGPEEFGTLYLASTVVGFAALAAELGQGGALQAAVARERSAAADLLFTSLAMRLGAFVIAHATLALALVALGYGRAVAIAVAWLTVHALLGHFSGSFQLVVRAVDRGDRVARNGLLAQVSNAACVIPTLVAGAPLPTMLGAQTLGVAATVALDARALGALGLPRGRFSRERARVLLRDGAGFLFLGVALSLQSNVDAILLSRLAPEEVVGWLAAARRLVGFLIFPVVAVSGAIYPTLCRLCRDDPEEFRGTLRGALRVTALLGVPAALGTGLFPELGTQIFGRQGYAEAEDDLRILAVFTLLLYFTILLGTAVNALGRQRVWALVQFACVGVSAALDPLLVPWFQQRTGNGGLGVCVATTTSEALMLVAAVALVGRGLVDRGLLRALGVTFAGGIAMAAVAVALRALSPWLVAPLSLVAYAAALRAGGELGAERIAQLRGLLRRPRG